MIDFDVSSPEQTEPEPGAQPMRGASTASPWRRRIRQVAPWVITIAVVVLILRKYSLGEIRLELAQGNWLGMVPVAALMAAVLVVLVAKWDALVLQGLLGRPRYWDVLRGRAATSMLLTIGYSFGHGGYGLWIARRAGASVGETAGIILFIAAGDLCGLATVTTVMIWLGGVAVPISLAITAPAIAGVMFLQVLAGPLPWFRNLPVLFQPWHRLPRWVGVTQILGRCINISFILVMTWLGSRTFGLNIPFWVMTAYLPIILLVGSLPVNIAGFGAVQGAWLLFEPWASGPAIIAFQFVWHLLVTVMLVLRGLPFIRRVIAEIDDGSAGKAKGRQPADQLPPRSG
jgi:hypothetical protein